MRRRRFSAIAMAMNILLLFALGAASGQPDNTMILVLALLGAVGAWFGARALLQGMRAGKTDAVIQGDFTTFALEALANAAKIDGRVTEPEVHAIVKAMGDIAGPDFGADRVSAALASARLSKEELIAFLSSRASNVAREQKLKLLKALMNVFVADGAFDEGEHQALVEYTAAIGFDRQGAVQMLRGLAGDFRRGNIT